MGHGGTATAGSVRCCSGRWSGDRDVAVAPFVGQASLPVAVALRPPVRWASRPSAAARIVGCAETAGRRQTAKQSAERRPSSRPMHYPQLAAARAWSQARPGWADLVAVLAVLRTAPRAAPPSRRAMHCPHLGRGWCVCAVRRCRTEGEARQRLSFHASPAVGSLAPAHGRDCGHTRAGMEPPTCSRRSARSLRSRRPLRRTWAAAPPGAARGAAPPGGCCASSRQGGASLVHRVASPQPSRLVGNA